MVDLPRLVDLATKVPEYVKAVLSVFRCAREWTATDGEESECPYIPEMQGVFLSTLTEHRGAAPRGTRKGRTA